MAGRTSAFAFSKHGAYEIPGTRFQHHIDNRQSQISFICCSRVAVLSLAALCEHLGGAALFVGRAT